jgi:hypothetical protein
MLRIKIELVTDTKVKTLAVADIGNVSDLASTSTYRVRAIEFDNPVSGDEGYIVGHDRSAPVWRLIEKVAKWAADSIDNRYVPSAKP